MDRPRAATVELSAGSCVEVYRVGGLDDGALIGYAILFAGSWDAWLYKVGHMVRATPHGFRDKHQAIAAVKMYA